MLNNITIPDEVVKAAISAYNYASTDCYSTQEQDMTAAILAALKAWPGSAVCHYTIADDEGYEMVLPLPFLQETRDDE